MANEREVDNALIPSLNFMETDTPTTPNDGHSIYFNTSGVMQILDHIGQSQGVGGGITAVMLQQTMAAGNNGGGMSPVETWIKRDLNSKQGDMSLADLSSGVITPANGVYIVYGWATIYQCIRNVTRLRNVTQNTTVVHGSSEYAGYGHSVTIKSIIAGIITANGTDEYEFQHMSTDNFGSPAQGVEVGGALDNEIEVYAALLLARIGD